MTGATLSYFAAERRAPKCSICGQPARPGATLCAQCKAALKRARQVTVSQFEPLPRKRNPADARSTSRKTRVRVPVDADPHDTVARAPRRRRTPALLVVAGIAVAALGVAATVMRFDPGSLELALVGAAPVLAPAPQVARAPEPAAALAALAPVSPVAVPAPPAPAENRVPGPAPAARTPVAARRVPAAVPSSVVDDPMTAFGPVVEPPPPTPVAAAAQPPRVAPPPDRWQAMTAAIARCKNNEEFIGRVVCEQRVRLQACEGYWGQAPQCPSGIQNDHGQ